MHSKIPVKKRITCKIRELIRRAELRRLVPYSDGHIWRLERAGAFPHRVQLGPHAVAWYEDEVEAWCESRIRAGAHRPPGRSKKPSVEVHTHRPAQDRPE